MQTNVFEKYTDYRVKLETLEIKEGYHLDIYVEKNLIEIFINNGEYVISNIVYNLNKEIHAKLSGSFQIYTVDKK